MHGERQPSKREKRRLAFENIAWSVFGKTPHTVIEKLKQERRQLSAEIETLNMEISAHIAICQEANRNYYRMSNSAPIGEIQLAKMTMGIENRRQLNRYWERDSLVGQRNEIIKQLEQRLPVGDRN